MFFANNLRAEEVLIAKSHENWPPVYWQEKDGSWKGENIEMYEALFKEAGVSYIFKPIPWARALKGLETGECHVMSLLTPTEERKKSMHFLGPHEKEEMALIVSDEYKDTRIENLDELTLITRKSGKKIGIQKGAFYSIEFNERLKNDPEFTSHFYEMTNTKSLMKMVVGKRLLGYIEVKLFLAWQIKSNPEYKGLVIHNFILSSTDVYFGVSKKLDPVTFNKLKNANQRLLDNGTYGRIAAKWRE